jgi:hypothetical protein
MLKDYKHRSSSKRPQTKMGMLYVLRFLLGEVIRMKIILQLPTVQNGMHLPSRSALIRAGERSWRSHYKIGCNRGSRAFIRCLLAVAQLRGITRKPSIATNLMMFNSSSNLYLGGNSERALLKSGSKTISGLEIIFRKRQARIWIYYSTILLATTLKLIHPPKLAEVTQ